MVILSEEGEGKQKNSSVTKDAALERNSHRITIANPTISQADEPLRRPRL